MTTTVIGLDLSLTSTGIALVANGKVRETTRIRSSGKAGAPIAEMARRLAQLEDDIIGWVEGLEADLAVIESPSFESRNGSGHERAHLWWAVARNLINRLAVPVGTVAPATLKVYATGNGRADKGDVVAAVRAKYAPAGAEPNNDECDAIVLGVMGSRWLGAPCEPDESLDWKQLKAMTTAKWPL